MRRTSGAPDDWLRINRVLRVMLHTRWSAEAWLVVRVEFRRALALRRTPRRSPSTRWARAGTSDAVGEVVLEIGDDLRALGETMEASD